MRNFSSACHTTATSHKIVERLRRKQGLSYFKSLIVTRLRDITLIISQLVLNVLSMALYCWQL